MTDPTAMPVSISPDLSAGGLGLSDAALLLAAGGLRVVPMTSVPTARKPDEPASKNPGGLLGKGWQHKTTTDPATIQRWFDPSGGSASGASIAAAAASDFYREVPYDTMVLGIHTGDDLVVLDIDDWSAVPTEYRAELLDASVPFQSSSTTDPNRGHYLFRPRDGYRYGAGALKPGDGSDLSPGEVRHGNSIIVSAPSVHAKERLGRRYEWQRTGTPPVMSERLAEWCGRNKDSKGSSWQESTWIGNELVFDPASGSQVDEFMSRCTTSNHPEVIPEHVAYMARLADNEGLHGAFLGPLVDMMKFAAFGFVNASEAAQAAMETFVAMRTDHSRAALGGNVTDEASAQREFLDSLQWAIGKTVAQLHLDPDALEYECFEQIQSHYVPGIELPERPEYVPEPPPPVLKRMQESIYYEGEREPVRATHAAVAAAMVKHVVDKLRWCSDQGIWYVYDDVRRLWYGGKELDTVAANIVARLLETTIQPVNEVTFGKAIHQAELNKDQREADRLQAIVNATPGGSLSDKYSLDNDAWGESVAAREGILKTLKTENELHVKASDFDSARDRMAVGNGVLDLSPLAAPVPARPVLLEDSPDHLITFRSSTIYDPNATAPTWNKLIHDAFDDHANINKFLQCWFGMSIDRVKNYKRFLLAYGKSHSGKGMIFGHGASMVFGNPQDGHSLVAAVDKGLIVKTGIDMSGHRKRVIADLRGKAMAYIDESGDGGSVDTDYLKSYTGGMPMEGERKYENRTQIDVPPLVVSSNHEWRLGDVDAGTSNRVISLYFAKGHGAGAPAHMPDDPMLPNKLAAEASGILNWALEGYMLWIHGGRDLVIPTSMQEQTDAMNAQASEFGTYLDIALEKTGDETDKVTFKQLWDGWDNETHGYKRVSMSRSVAANVSPKAVRLMRKSIEEHTAAWGETVYATHKTAKVQALHGVKLTEEGEQYVTGMSGWMGTLGSAS